MTEHETQPGSPSPVRVGWYRDQRTGQRRYWNGAAWLALDELVTPFTFDPRPREEAHTPDLAERSRQPSGPGRSRVSPRTKLAVAGSVAVAAIVAALFVLDTGTPSPVSAHRHIRSSTQAPDSGEPSSRNAASPTSTLAPAVEAAPVASAPPSTTSPGQSAEATQLVTVVGDSITALSSAQIENWLGRNFSPDVHAVVGTTMSYWAPFIESVVRSQPSHDWVIALGTNDIHYAYTPNWEADFNNEVTLLSGQRCVVLVSVNPRLGSAATQLDADMAGVVATHPDFHLLNWGEIEFENPQWLLSDQIHPSHRGSVELAKLERQALLTQC